MQWFALNVRDMNFHLNLQGFFFNYDSFFYKFSYLNRNSCNKMQTEDFFQDELHIYPIRLIELDKYDEC